MRIRTWIALLLTVLLFSCSFAEGSEASSVVYAKQRARIYANADGSDSVCVVYADYPLNVLGSSGKFYHVADPMNQFEGYIRKDMTSPDAAYPFEIDPAYKVYYKRTTSSTEIPKALLSNRKTLSSNMEISEYKAYLMYIAQCKVGCQYNRWPDNRYTFNNISLVQTCLGVFGYTVPDDAYRVGHEGSQIYLKREDLQKGDVVCFATDNEDGITDHIGIYIGQGRFIHCSPVAGCVLVSNLDTGFYARTLLWGRRYLAVD